MGRAPCCDKKGLKKGHWTSEEDQKLIDYIQKNGYGNWRTLPKNAGLERCGKSCRLRWTNYLRPDIKRGRFSFDEEETIIQLHNVLGNKWSAIAARLPGRTDNEIKNYWNTHIRKRLLRTGIDPVTHSPRLDLLDISSILTSTLYNSTHQMNNISRLLAVQQLVNPELLRLATSLLSSSQQNHNFLRQNVQENRFCQPQINQFHASQDQTLIQELPTRVPSQLMEPFSSNIANFNAETWQNKGMSSNLDTYNYDHLENYNYNGSEQSIMDYLLSDDSDYQSNNNFNLPSDFSTPSSSPTPLHSNSTTSYINGSSTDDEREQSYCSDLLKFDIPDILNVLI